MAVKIMKAGRKAAARVSAVNIGNGALISIKCEDPRHHDVVLYLTGAEVESLTTQLNAVVEGADSTALLATL